MKTKTKTTEPTEPTWKLPGHGVKFDAHAAILHLRRSLYATSKLAGDTALSAFRGTEEFLAYQKLEATQPTIEADLSAARQTLADAKEEYALALAAGSDCPELETTIGNLTNNVATLERRKAATAEALPIAYRAAAHAWHLLSTTSVNESAADARASGDAIIARIEAAIAPLLDELLLVRRPMLDGPRTLVLAEHVLGPAPFEPRAAGAPRPQGFRFPTVPIGGKAEPAVVHDPGRHPRQGDFKMIPVVEFPGLGVR